MTNESVENYKRVNWREFREDFCLECGNKLEREFDRYYGSYYYSHKIAYCTKCEWWNYDFLYEDTNGDSDSGDTIQGKGLEHLVDFIAPQGSSATPLGTLVIEKLKNRIKQLKELRK
ncbi:MAG: hypothetical protein AABX73_02315 [Nanoarchaeota archaeon]